MERLRPGRYEAQPRSSSSGSQASSTGTSSSRSTQTPLTSPSLSTTDSDTDYAWKGYSAEDSSQGLSPLELLMQRGKQVQHDIWNPEVDSAHSGKSKIFERATALSRKTSVKQAPIQPSPDPDGFDDTRSIRSINLQADGASGSTFSRSSRRGRSDQGQSEPAASPSSHWMTAKELAHQDDDTVGPQRFASPSTAPRGHGADQPSWQSRDGEHLLGNAFRNSIASDISFNSITGQDDRMSIFGHADGGQGDDLYSSNLSRRNSVDTVRSSEFGEHGRWGQAWANKAEDEESLYGESAYGDGSRDEDDHWDPDRYSLISKDVVIDPSLGESPYDLSSRSRLDNITSQWRATQHQDSAAVPSNHEPQRLVQQQQRAPGLASPLPQILSAPAKEHVVNLTRTVAGPSTSTTKTATNALAPPAAAASQNRQSHVPSIYETDVDAQGSMYYVDVEQTPVANSRRELGHRANDSTSTLDPNGARVYVYPPSPSSSEGSRAGGFGGATHTPLPQSRTAVVETIGDSPEQAMASHRPSHALQHPDSKPSFPNKGPVAPSNLLAQPRDSPIIGAGANRRKTSGHPAGRPPPPTPIESEFGHAGYIDPNQPSPTPAAARPVLGRARIEAIAAANGRESIVSDLDVETLRLDGSSRRDSTSTINSVATSRMSVGTVRYEDIGLSETAEDPADPNVATNAPTKATWDPSARLRPSGRPNPSRALTSPSESSVERSLDASGSSAHSMQNQGLSNAGQHWSNGGGTPLRTQLSHSNFDTKGTSSSIATPFAPPPLRQAKSSAAINMGQSGSANGLYSLGHGSGLGPGASSGLAAASTAMKPTMSASSDSAATTSSIASSSRSTRSQGSDMRTGPASAEDYLSHGITYHEQGDLSRSAFYFERSAKVDGGCVVGMCMFGMALREGWGARKDPRKGFEWIQRAAAKAGELMGDGGAKSDGEIKAIKSELKLSVYELGKCFCYGWGVKQDKAMALEYFELAAKLGDADAQAEAGALYASGKGCKKDLKKAAMYYRMAEKGGYDTVGLSWIHKDKYR